MKILGLITLTLSSCIKAASSKCRYPEENQRFDNVVYTDPVPGDIQGSLQLMREQMLSKKDPIGAVFIKGMDGV
ncbi:hypothetical protein ACKU07_23415 [Enterobacter hormaechei]